MIKTDVFVGIEFMPHSVYTAILLLLNQKQEEGK
jgi:hypothetical protein